MRIKTLLLVQYAIGKSLFDAHFYHFATYSLCRNLNSGHFLCIDEFPCDDRLPWKAIEKSAWINIPLPSNSLRRSLFSKITALIVLLGHLHTKWHDSTVFAWLNNRQTIGVFAAPLTKFFMFFPPVHKRSFLHHYREVAFRWSVVRE